MGFDAAAFLSGLFGGGPALAVGPKGEVATDAESEASAPVESRFAAQIDKGRQSGETSGADDPAMYCPWCRGTELADDCEGLRCAGCGGLAFRDLPTGGIVRCDGDRTDYIDPPAACSTCGGLMLWWDLAGGAHCRDCDPPTKSWQLMELRERILARGERRSHQSADIAD